MTSGALDVRGVSEVPSSVPFEEIGNLKLASARFRRPKGLLPTFPVPQVRRDRQGQGPFSGRWRFAEGPWLNRHISRSQES